MHDHMCEVSRREFMKTGTALTAAAAAAASLPAVAAFAEDKPAKGLLAMRKLGKTNVGVSILNLGTAGAMDNRLFNTTWGLRAYGILTPPTAIKTATARRLWANGWPRPAGARKCSSSPRITRRHPTSGSQ